MKTAILISSCLISPWLLAQSLSTRGEDALRSDSTEGESFGADDGYDPGRYSGFEEGQDENTLETDSASKEGSLEGGSKGGGEKGENPNLKGGDKAHSDATEEGSFAEEAPKMKAKKKKG